MHPWTAVVTGIQLRAHRSLTMPYKLRINVAHLYPYSKALDTETDKACGVSSRSSILRKAAKRAFCAPFQATTT